MTHDDVGDRAKSLVKTISMLSTLEAKEMVAQEFLDEEHREIHAALRRNWKSGCSLREGPQRRPCP